MILVDTGPLVALVQRDGAHLTECRNVLKSLEEPLGIVWPVVTEASHLLAYSWQAQGALFDMIQTDAFQWISLSNEDMPRIRELMRKYQDLPMDLADAALVRVAERERIARIFTLDRRDFGIYRPKGIGRFSILPR